MIHSNQSRTSAASPEKDHPASSSESVEPGLKPFTSATAPTSPAFGTASFNTSACISFPGQFDKSDFPIKRVRNHVRHSSVGTNIPIASPRPGAQYTSKSGSTRIDSVCASTPPPERSGRGSYPMTASLSKQDSRSLSVPAKFDASRYQPKVEDDDEDRPTVPTIPKKLAPKTAPKEPSPLKQSTTPPDLSPPQADVETAQPTSADTLVNTPTDPPPERPARTVNILDFLTPDSDGEEDEASQTPRPASVKNQASAFPSSQSSPGSVPSLIHSDGGLPPPCGDAKAPLVLPGPESYLNGYPTAYVYNHHVDHTGFVSPTLLTPQLSPNVGPLSLPLSLSMSRTHSGAETAIPSSRAAYPQSLPNGVGPILSPSMVSVGTTGGLNAKAPEWNAITRIRAGKKSRPPPPPASTWSQSSSAQSTPSVTNAAPLVPYNPSMFLPPNVGSPNLGPYGPALSPYSAPQSCVSLPYPYPASAYGAPGPQCHPTQPMTVPMPPSYSVPRPYYALGAPSLESRTIAGYELVASKLTTGSFQSADDSSAPTDSIPPLYRKFESLHHRILLHIQDELAEMEEQLRNIDEQCANATARMTSSSPANNDDDQSRPPSSRRAENRSAVDLFKHRTGLLGRIYLKMNQYTTALEAYKKSHQCFDDANSEEIKSYRSFLELANPLDQSEARFLDNDKDLMMLNRPRKPLKAQSHNVSQATVKLPFFASKETDLSSMLFFLVALLAGLSILLSVGLFTFVMIVLSSYMPMLPFVCVLLSILSGFCISKILTTIVALDKEGLLINPPDTQHLSMGRRVWFVLSSAIFRLVSLKDVQETGRCAASPSTPSFSSEICESKLSDSDIDNPGEPTTPTSSTVTPMAPSGSSASARRLSSTVAIAPNVPSYQTYPSFPSYMNMPVMRPLYHAANGAVLPDNGGSLYSTNGLPQVPMGYPKLAYPMSGPVQHQAPYLPNPPNGAGSMPAESLPGLSPTMALSPQSASGSLSPPSAQLKSGASNYVSTSKAMNDTVMSPIAA